MRKLYMLLWAKKEVFKEVYLTISFEQCSYVIVEKSCSVTSGPKMVNDYRHPKNVTKYFCQSHINNIVLPSSNKWLSKSNSKTFDDALDNTIITSNNNKNDFQNNCNSINIPFNDNVNTIILRLNAFVNLI